MDTQQIKPPKTIEEVGIHLVYMSQKIGELNSTILKQSATHATKEEVDEFKIDVNARLKVLETKNTIKDTLLWFGLVASAVINIVFIYQLFTGNK